MAPTGRYPPGQLVWVKVRTDIDEFDYDGSYTPRMDVANFKVAWKKTIDRNGQRA